MDANDYRAIMRHQTGAVTVIACGSVGARDGLTATAVTSLSDDPPMVVACVRQTAWAHDAIVRFGVFGVSLLSDTQQEIAERFAGKGGLKGEARFAGSTWHTLATGSPILTGALASLDCELVGQHSVSTHSIFIGRVVAGEVGAGTRPLLYYRGDYWNLDLDQAGREPWGSRSQ